MKLSFSLATDPHQVFRYLSQPELFVSVHPVVYKMEPLGLDRYKVFEKTRFGFFLYSFTYEAEVQSDPVHHKVVISAIVKKYTNIEMTFVVKPGNHGTIVEEEVSIRSPLLLKGFLEKFIRKQHNILFENIGKLAHEA